MLDMVPEVCHKQKRISTPMIQQCLRLWHQALVLCVCIWKSAMIQAIVDVPVGKSGAPLSRSPSVTTPSGLSSSERIITVVRSSEVAQSHSFTGLSDCFVLVT